MVRKIFNFKYNKFNPSVNEWSNSVYNFNKNNFINLDIIKITSNIINNYFNISLIKEINTKFPLKRIFVGLPEIKNSLNKINIFIYVFNKEIIVLNKKLNKLQKMSKVNKNNFSYSLLNVQSNNVNNWFKLYRNIVIEKFYNSYSIVMKRKYYVLFLYKRYITRVYFNKLKFNYINLLNLNQLFFNIFNKNININIINLKYLYLDNSIYIDAIVRKLKKRNRKVLKVLRKALILPKIPRIDSMFLLKRKDEINNIIYNIISINGFIDLNNIKRAIFESLKNIHVIGMRLEGKGRLTRRLTASRAIHKKAYKGSLKNVYSSFKGLSALMTKGYNKSNLNYTNLNSYNRNGSYGIKSWQNTM